MRRIYLVLDLALLQKDARDARLQQLAIAIARIWATYRNEDFTWGYTLYDSSIGNVLLLAKLRRTASHLKLPKHFHEASNGDLSISDLASYLSLITTATDEVRQAAMAAGSERQRAAKHITQPEVALEDGPSHETTLQALSSALQTALNTNFLQKLATAATGEASVSGSGQPTQGVLAIFTSYIATGNSTGSMMSASMLEKCSAARLHLSWIMAGLQQQRQLDVGNVLALPLHVVAGEISPQGYVALLGLPVSSSDVVQSKQPAGNGGDEQEDGDGDDNEDIWPGQDFDTDGVKLLIAALERAGGGPYDDDIKRNARERHRKAQTALRNKPAPVHAAKNNRRSALRSQAKNVLQRAGSTAGCSMMTAGTADPSKATQNNNNNIDMGVVPQGGAKTGAAEDDASSVVALELDVAMAQLTESIAGAAAMGYEYSIAPPAGATKSSIPATRLMTDRIKGLVQSTYTAVLAHPDFTAAGEEGPILYTRICDAILNQASVSVDRLKAEHKACPHEKVQELAWGFMAQVALRLSAIAASSNAVLPASVKADIQSLMHLIAATLKPVPLGGRRFFADAVKPTFSAALAHNIRQLETALWDDEDDDDDEEEEDNDEVEEEGMSGEAPMPGDDTVREHGRAFGEDSGETCPNRRSMSPGAAGAGAGGSQQQQHSSIGAPSAAAIGGGSRRTRSSNPAPMQTKVQKLQKAARSEGGPLRSLTTGRAAAAAAAAAGGASRSAMSAENSGVNGSVGGGLQATATAPDRMFQAFSQRFNNSGRYKQLVHRGLPKTSKPLSRAGSGIAAANILNSSKALTTTTTTSAGTVPNPSAVSAPDGSKRVKRATRKSGVPDTPQDDAKTETGVAGRKNARAALQEVTSPCVFSPIDRRHHGRQQQQQQQQQEGQGHEEMLDAVPDTNMPQGGRHMAFREGQRASQRYLCFDGGDTGGLPGAILPADANQAGANDALDTVKLNAAATAAAPQVPTGPATWVQAAMVPKGNKAPVTRPAQAQNNNPPAPLAQPEPVVEQPQQEEEPLAVELVAPDTIEQIVAPAASAPVEAVAEEPLPRTRRLTRSQVEHAAAAAALEQTKATTTITGTGSAVAAANKPRGSTFVPAAVPTFEAPEPSTAPVRRSARSQATSVGAPSQAPAAAPVITKIKLVGSHSKKQQETANNKKKKAVNLKSLKKKLQDGPLGCGRCPRATTGCSACRQKAVVFLLEHDCQGLVDMLGCPETQCRGPSLGCHKCWLKLLDSMVDPPKLTEEAAQEAEQPQPQPEVVEAPVARAPVVVAESPAPAPPAAMCDPDLVLIPDHPEEQYQGDNMSPDEQQQPAATGIQLDKQQRPFVQNENNPRRYPSQAYSLPADPVAYAAQQAQYPDPDTMTITTAVTVGMKRAAGASVGKTPSKKKRLGAMLGLHSKTPKVKKTPMSPPTVRPAHLLRDESSPCKPGTTSCYEGEWALEAEVEAAQPTSLPVNNTANRLNRSLGRPASARTAAAVSHGGKQQQEQEQQQKEDSSCGDVPGPLAPTAAPTSVMRALPRLDVSPGGGGGADDSDDEDAVVLAKAAKGELSPSSAGPGLGPVDQYTREEVATSEGGGGRHGGRRTRAASKMNTIAAAAAAGAVLETTPLSPNIGLEAANGAGVGGSPAGRDGIVHQEGGESTPKSAPPAVQPPQVGQQQRRISEAAPRAGLDKVMAVSPFPRDELRCALLVGENIFVGRFKVISVIDVDRGDAHSMTWNAEITTKPIDLPGVSEMTLNVHKDNLLPMGADPKEPGDWCYTFKAKQLASHAPPLPKAVGIPGVTASDRKRQRDNNSMSSGHILPLTEGVETARRSAKSLNLDKLLPKQLFAEGPLAVPSTIEQRRKVMRSDMPAHKLLGDVSPDAAAQVREMMGDLYAN